MSTKRAPEAVEYYWLDENCTKKPPTWDDCEEVRFSKEQKSMLFGSLPVLVTSDYQPINDLPKEAKHMPERFMVVWGGRTFYVNTEGCTYCRYALEVI
jgi:hypothetical protein